MPLRKLSEGEQPNSNAMNIAPPLEPVAFNCWKHHLRYVMQEIDAAVANGQEGVKSLTQHFDGFGDSYTDLYTGPARPQATAHEIVAQLGDLEVSEPEVFRAWLLQDELEYQLLHLSDLSFWKVKWSTDAERYICIEPGRHSYHSTRVKVDAWKTAIITTAVSKLYDTKADLELINSARAEFLGMNSLRALIPGGDLNRILTLINRKPISVTVV